MRLFLVRAEHLDEGVIDDLDDLLAGADRADDLFADSTHAHLLDEILDHRQGDVRLQQRDPDLAQGFVHVLVGQRAAAGQAVKDTAKTFAQGVEHGVFSPHDAQSRKAPLSEISPGGGPRRLPFAWNMGQSGRACWIAHDVRRRKARRIPQVKQSGRCQSPGMP